MTIQVLMHSIPKLVQNQPFENLDSLGRFWLIKLFCDKNMYLFEREGVGDTLITGSHIGGDTYMTSEMCTRIRISLWYWTYPALPNLFRVIGLNLRGILQVDKGRYKTWTGSTLIAFVGCINSNQPAATQVNFQEKNKEMRFIPLFKKSQWIHISVFDERKMKHLCGSFYVHVYPSSFKCLLHSILSPPLTMSTLFPGLGSGLLSIN